MMKPYSFSKFFLTLFCLKYVVFRASYLAAFIDTYRVIETLLLLLSEFDDVMAVNESYGKMQNAMENTSDEDSEDIESDQEMKLHKQGKYFKMCLRGKERNIISNPALFFFISKFCHNK